MILFRKISIVLILIGLIVVSCSKPATKTTSQRGLADMYNPGKSTIHPDFFVYHLNDTNSVLYIRVFPSELLFNTANPEGKNLAKLRIFFELRELSTELGEGIFVDSVSLNRTLNKDEVRNSFFSGLPIKANSGKKYSMRVEVSDEIRKVVSREILIVDKISPFNSQNFKVLATKTGYPAFTRYFSSTETFRLQFNKFGYDSVFVDFFSLDRTLPRPAFSSVAEVPLKTFPDTSFIYPFSDTTIYNLPNPGIYQFRLDIESKEGLTLFNFGETFPQIKTSDDLLGPLVYLTSSAEFRDLRMETNRKLAIDNFWLKLNADIESSRELIRVYYKRVYFANLLFSSFKEGWKTDQGMIYIIFGPPRKLEKEADIEKWTYFSKKGSEPIVFEFKRTENQFTNLDFQLVRSPTSGSFWREAVDAWRKGKVYSVDY